MVIKRMMCAVSVLGLLTAGSGWATAAPDRVGWRTCHDDLWCADVDVPADWSRPRAERITLGLLKIPARGDRLGTLVLNPGGPGPAVRNFALPSYREQFAELAERFDVVVFDPRGIGASSGVTCPTVNPVAVTPPLTEDAHAAYATANARFAADCASATGPLRVNARQVAHDLEAIREALGERKLNYFGNSYGTVYGQAYADLFGRHVGRMYLDSVLDHTRRDLADWARPGAVTAERNLHRLAEWCASDPGCALHGQDLVAVWDRVLASAPIPAPGTAGVDATQILAWAAGRIGNDRSRALLAAGLAQADQGDATAMIRRPGLPDTSLARTSLCSDFVFRDDYRSLERVETELRDTVAPRLGWATQAWNVSGHCSGLPRVGLFPPQPIRAHGLPPVLIANGDNDPLTPADHGRHVAAQLPGARYLATEGNHALYLRGNRCVRDHVHHYLWTGELPPPGARC
ncbi:pimeloyl-ACP methyl ester carboxylesterase [Saccharothrix tamanrassetensis]|uniref:Pimeloyl-ACP methyl ester carboxylesterase n=1 Tax=Saccharothrix tamanrassetensis TaxID=1051531 RepID=A0A841CHZ4_9PSEU|nr:alpha/beta fold hydrolase [Saccharothrix tamanrassetensis]MBB5955747.1 pimeloyl-ACP methyl ester carboxylesterase [Saccharothrix tamanrassetensis]